MKKLFLMVMSILLIFFVLFHIYSIDNKLYIEVCAPPELRMFMEVVAKRYEKINKNEDIKIKLYFDDAGYDSHNARYKYITRDKNGYEEWKKLPEYKDKNLNMNDFYYYLGSQKYEFDKKYDKFDIIIYTEDYLDKYYNESKYSIENFLRDRLVVIGRRELESISDIEGYNISIPNVKTKVGEIAYNFLLNNIKHDSLISDVYYNDDSLISLQSTDLYESDYSIVGKIPLKIAKNSFECYEIPLYLIQAINYKIASKKLENKNVKNLYNFLISEETKNIYNEYIK